jgi:arylsulfatase B
MPECRTGTCRVKLLLPAAIAWLAWLAAVGTGGAREQADSRPPNVVVILVDDLGYGELGCQGNTQIPTPHIDSLARSGVRFTRGYVTAPLCSPSRAGLLTGRYQTRIGHEFNPIGKENLDPAIGLPPAERTLAECLRAAGYATGLVGKWHLGGSEEYHPQRRGFDEFFGFLHEGHYYVPPPFEGVTSFLRVGALPDAFGGRKIEGRIVWSSHLGHDEPPYDESNPILRGSGPVAEPAHLTDALTREAVAFIDRHKERPFFLLLAYNAVHSPMQAADRYLERFAEIEDIQRRIFAALLAQLDDGVGDVLKKLRDEQLEERTLVFFLSDNGGPTKELTSQNTPLRGGKGQLFEGGIRVPFLVQWKGRLPAGQVFVSPVSSTDIFATAVAAARVALPKDRILDGADLVRHLTGPVRQPPHTTLFWRMGQNAALVDGDWKFVRHGAAQPPQLFNLARDAGETTNLAQREPIRLAEMHARWDQFNAQMVPPRWGSRPRTVSP